MTAPVTGECGICVIGGGPAGSTIARRLATLGHDVLVVEACAFPRPRIGESLPPSIGPVLDLAGVRERVEGAGFLRPPGAVVQWSGADAIYKRFERGPGFQVDRGRFDQLLLEAAREAGARVWQPARAGRPTATATGWAIPVGPVEIRAGFLVDAAGKQATMPRRRERSSAPGLALYGYWRGAGIRGPETLVEAARSAWYWGAPLPDGSFNAAVFVDPEACQGLGRTGLVTRYRSLLAQSRLLGVCLKGELTGPVRVCDATSYVDADPVSDTAIKVGEAAFSIDPLSSQGVQAAMMSGFQAAAVVHTILERPADAEAAREFYRLRQHDTVEWHRQVASSLYAEQDAFADEPFWRTRAAGAQRGDGAGVTETLDTEAPLALSSSARIVSVPTLDGDFVRRRDALAHPSLARPVAFLGPVGLVGLLREIEAGWTGTRIVDRWSRSLPRPRAQEILSWLWSRGVMTPAARHPSPAEEPSWR